MIFVCKNHVKLILEILKSPHISPVNIHTKCYFCEEISTYQAYYYDVKIKKRNKKALETQTI